MKLSELQIGDTATILSVGAKAPFVSISLTWG